MSSEIEKPYVEREECSEQETTLAAVIKRRKAALAEENKLGKYLHKAEQRIAAHKREFALLEARRQYCRSGSPETRHLLALIDKALNAWGAAADNRLSLIDRLCAARENARKAETTITKFGFKSKLRAELEAQGKLAPHENR